MAVQAAHFTTTSQGKPTIFEIIAQDSLNDTLHPALQKIALVLANNFPRRFLWLSDYYDELFLTLNVLLQYHYITRYGSSFAENFYGLKRISIGDKPFTNDQKRLSLLLLVVLPYFKKKLRDKIMMYKLQSAEGSLRNNLQDSLKKVLIQLHSTFQFTWSMWTLINYLRYMSHQVESQQPWLRIVGLKLVYSDDASNNDGFWSALIKGHLSFSEISTGLLRNTISSTLEATAFFLQFLQVWNAERPNYNPAALPVPPPPPCDNIAQNYMGKCPICLQSFKIPTVLPVSGYVFCFPCIIRYLRENQCCPVTNLPARPLDIIRIYDS